MAEAGRGDGNPPDLVTTAPALVAYTTAVTVAARAAKLKLPKFELYPASLEQRAVCAARYEPRDGDTAWRLARTRPMGDWKVSATPGSLKRLDLLAGVVAEELNALGLRPADGGPKPVLVDERARRARRTLTRRRAEGGEIVALDLRLGFGGQVLVALHTTARGVAEYAEVAERLVARENHLAGVVRVAAADARHRARRYTLYGTDFVDERLLGFTLHVDYDAATLDYPAQRETEIEWLLHAVWSALDEGKRVSPESAPPLVSLPEQGEVSLPLVRLLGRALALAPANTAGVRHAATHNRYVVETDDRPPEQVIDFLLARGQTTPAVVCSSAGPAADVICARLNELGRPVVALEATAEETASRVPQLVAHDYSLVKAAVFAQSPHAASAPPLIVTVWK